MNDEYREEIKQIVREVLEEYQNNTDISSLQQAPIVSSCSLRYEDLPDFLTEEQVLQITGWSKKTLYNKRCKREVPYYSNINHRYPKKEFYELLFGKIVLPSSIQREDISKRVNERLNKSRRTVGNIEKVR